jgi:hypothetical protein
MNQYEWKQQSRRLMASQEKFVQMMYLQYEHIEALTEYMSGFRDYMGGFREAFGGWSGVFKGIHEAMQEELTIVKQLDETLTAMKKAITDNYVATNENNERIEKLLTKVEAYFGTTGLDYDN